jgi:hypothetical protein
MNGQDFIDRTFWVDAGFIMDKMGQTLYLRTKKTLLIALHHHDPVYYEVCWRGL